MHSVPHPVEITYGPKYDHKSKWIVIQRSMRPQSFDHFKQVYDETLSRCVLKLQSIGMLFLSQTGPFKMHSLFQTYLGPVFDNILRM